MELSEFFASDGYAYCENNDGIIHMFELFEKCPHDSLTYKYYAAFDKSSGPSATVPALPHKPVPVR